MASRNSSPMIVKYDGPIASITLNRPDKMGALFPEDYEAFAEALYEIDKREDVIITVWQGRGRFFCAGTNVSREDSAAPKNRRQRVAEITAVTDCSRALYTHSKILVAALNGPALGIGAAFLGQFDFVYATPDAWIAVPFSALGIVAEVGASVTFAQRMGQAKANEVLLWGRKVTAEDLVACGFVNKIFPKQAADTSSPPTVASQVVASDAFNASIHVYLHDMTRDLDPVALLSSRALIHAGLRDIHDPDAINLRESTEQVARFMSGEPQIRFGQIARKERRHRL